MSVTVIEWDGLTLPEGLSKLPPGQYLVEPTRLTDLTPEERAGLLSAFEELDRGETLDYDEVMTSLREHVSSK